jgi:hypothetical protein
LFLLQASKARSKEMAKPYYRKSRYTGTSSTTAAQMNALLPGQHGQQMDWTETADARAERKAERMAVALREAEYRRNARQRREAGK